MATYKDIARMAGVSTTTVSHVINKTRFVSEETKAKVLRAIEALNYHPNALAKGLATRKTHTIALIIPSVTNQFFSAIARGVQDEAKKRGYCMILCNTDEDEASEIEYMKMVREKRIDGFIITPPGTNENANKRSNIYLSELRRDGFPFVMIGRRADIPDVDVVTSDSQGGAYRAICHLAELGHRRIAFIGGPFSKGVGLGRLRGYKRAMQDYKLEEDPKMILEGNLREDGGYELMRQLLSAGNPPTAIFAINDMMAIGALGACNEAGASVPGDMSIVGYDDIPLASIVRPRLTSVAQPSCEMGSKSAELLIERIEGRGPKGGRTIVMETKLMIRESTGRPRG
ncbi:MAG: LacI family DNA-binding transcriptional regulator [bacterium]